MIPSKYQEYRKKVVENCSKVIVGKEDVLQLVLTCFVCSGHILLEDMPGLEGGISSELAGSTAWLRLLPDPSLLEDQSLLGAIWYDAAAGRMKMQPLSIVTDTAIARLLY